MAEESKVDDAVKIGEVEPEMSPDEMRYWAGLLTYDNVKELAVDVRQVRLYGFWLVFAVTLRGIIDIIFWLHELFT